MLSKLVSAKRARRKSVRKEKKLVLEKIFLRVNSYDIDCKITLDYQETIDYLEKLGYKVEGKVNERCKITW